MKKIKKALACIIAMSMCMAYSTVTFATENDNVEAPVVYDVADPVATEDSGIMPASAYTSFYESSGPETEVVTVPNVHLSANAQLYFTVSSNVQLRVDIYQWIKTTEYQGDVYKLVKSGNIASTNSQTKVYNLGSGFNGVYKVVVTPASSGHYFMALGKEA